MHCLWKYEVIGKGSYIYNNVVVLHTIVFSIQPFPLTLFQHCVSNANKTLSIIHVFFKISIFARDNGGFLLTQAGILHYQDTISINPPLSRANILYLGIESSGN